MIDENSKVQYLKGVGEKRAEILAKLGIFTVGDLLRYYPRAYRDWSNVKSISDTVIGEECCVRAVVDKTPSGAKIRKGLTLFKTKVTDGTDVMNIIIYNNRFAAQSLEQGAEYIFYGKIGGNFTSKEMSAPDILKADGTNEIIHPVYLQTQGINSKYIEKLVLNVFSQNSAPCEEVIPDGIREKLCLMKINDALREIHFPVNEDFLSEAKRRLVFEELFILQLGLMSIKGIKKSESSVLINDCSDEFFKSLPFNPTGAQSKAINECLFQMRSGYVMNRLLQGDVGSGKTMVAATLIHSTVKSGYQCAFMAPTEILASQHFSTVKMFFAETDFKIELITGSMTAKNKNLIKERLQNGDIDIIIGTHALIQSDVVFKNIGLVITDEQHRFGVKQRNALTMKGNTPHTLVMSATPIPRTLALMIYGDLDISILYELPPGRQPTETYFIDSSKRQRAYNYVKKHLDEGRQGYIVCPLVEESDVMQLASAEDFAQKLSENDFKDYRVGIIHGKMKPKDKDAVMKEFVSGDIQLLVSTTVIEVGVDVPNAVIMIIENAERFGLSQLHQLRGRIGRGKHKSTCILISDAESDTALARLKAMTQTSDGFKIADEDLKLRGPGDFFGNRQHGLPEMKIAMLTDKFTLKEANTFAKEILKSDPELSSKENTGLKKAVNRLFGNNKFLN